MVQDVVDRDGSEQSVVLIDDGHRHQVVGGHVAGDDGKRLGRSQRFRIGVEHATDQARRWLSQQALNVSEAEVLTGRGLRRRPAYVHLTGQRGRDLLVSYVRERLGDGGVWWKDDRLASHHAARRIFRVWQQAQHRRCLLGRHEREQALCFLDRKVAEEVGSIVRIHRLKHVGCAVRRQFLEDFDLIVLREFLEYVGEPAVVERGGYLRAALRREFVHDAGEVGGAQLLQRRKQVDRTLGFLRQGDPADLLPVQDDRLAAAAKAAAA